MKVFIKLICVLVGFCIMAGALSSCGKIYKNKTPDYPSAQFEICGLWAPREMSEEAFVQYKDAGFNVLSFTNHDEQPRSSENQYYIGSKRTLEALKLCKKVGLDAYIAYGDSWFNRANEGDEYFDNKPFSTYDYYQEYKDIIKGVHIKDEPNKENLPPYYSKELIADFKKVYPNAHYMINLIPQTAGSHIYGYETYSDLVSDYAKNIMSQFDTSYISLDFYPFHTIAITPDYYILENYELIAKTAKEYNGKKTFILQAGTGLEFEETLSEGDMRWQVYTALGFGADNLQYYCYSVPEDREYNCCMLEPDNKTPSELYYYVKDLNYEIQSFASVILSYDWDETVGVSGSEETTYRVATLEMDENFNKREFKKAKYLFSAQGSHDMIISRFESEQYGEGYMFVNFAARENANTITATFKECDAVAIYGGKGYTGVPKVIELDEIGNVAINLEYGDGVFIIPLI